MFNYNPYLNYYKNKSNYYTYNHSAFFNHTNAQQIQKNTKIYSFNNNTSNNNTDNQKKIEELKDNIKEKIDSAKTSSDDYTKKTNTDSSKTENTRFSIGNFSITDRGINAFGYHINFDDLIIIFLILFLYFETNTDLSIIIVLGLMLFDINFSTIKNIF